MRVIRIGCLRMVEARALAVRALYDLKGIILEFEIEKKNKNGAECLISVGIAQ